MKVYFIIIVFAFSILSLSGQNKKDCRQLLKKEITLNDFTENTDEFIKDFETLIYCEFDSIDFQIFMGPQGNMPLIAQSLISLTSNSKRNSKKFTFKDLRNILNKFKQTEEYLYARKIVEAGNKIIQKEATLENWNSDKQLLLQMGLNENQINDIYKIIKKNEHKKYIEIFAVYSDSLKAKQEKTENKFNDNPEIVEWIKGLYAYKDYEKALSKSKELNKPALLYFNGYGCVNSRKVEDRILSNPDIRNYINNNLIFVSLIVDERTKLQENEVYFSEILNDEVNYTGQKMLEIEIKLYKSNKQPLFVLLDTNQKEISRIGYTDKIEEFKKFLNMTSKQ